MQVGKLMEARLQITLWAAFELITCHFIIIPETHFLPFEKLSPIMGTFLLFSVLLVSCLILFFFLYCSIDVWEKKFEIYLSTRDLRLFLQSLTDSFNKHSPRATL